jgi:hypothetical protein
MFWKKQKKKLFEYDPKTLSVELLSILYGSLLAKLLLVTQELQERYEKIASLTEPVPNTEADRATLMEGAKKLRGFGLILENVLSQHLERMPPQKSGEGTTN